MKLEFQKRSALKFVSSLFTGQLQSTRMQNESQDFILWGKFKNGDSCAFDQIYDRYIDALYAFGLSYSTDKELIKKLSSSASNQF